MDKKLVYLGFHKCGTTSVWKFFEEHGFKVIHNPIQVCDGIGLATDLPKGVDLENCIDTDRLDQFVEQFDVLTDSPFPVLYRHFDRLPGKFLFVLGTRPTDQWICSMQRYFGTRMPALGHAVYDSDGNPCTDPDAFRRTYNEHNACVREYFKGRNDFIEIQLGVESNAVIRDRLVDFVGLPKNSGVTFGIRRPN